MSNPFDERVKELAEMTQKSYFTNSLINSPKAILTPIQYTDENIRFEQIAHRTKIPNWIFEERADNSSVAGSFASSIIYSEIKYLFDKLSAAVQEENVGKINIKTIVDKIGSLPNVDFIFIPLKSIYELLATPSKFLNNWEYIEFENKKIPLIHSHQYLQFNDIILVDKSGIELVQKKSSQMKKFSNYPRYLENMSINKEDTPLQILFGKPTGDRKNMEMVLRVVYGIKRIDENKIKKLKIEL